MDANYDDRQMNLADELTATLPHRAQEEDTLQTQRHIAHAAGLFQSDMTVRTLLESLAEGLIVHDRDGTIVLINRRAEEIFGYTQAEVLGRSLHIFLPERFVKTHENHLADYYANPYIRPMGQELELVGRRKDGTEFPVEVSISALRAESGYLGLALVTDITRRKTVERELQQQNEALDDFAQTVAHELNTSLALIVGYSQTLVETHETLPGEQLRSVLLVMAKYARKMSNIISELLLLASMRQEDVEYFQLDMAQIISEALQRLQFEIRETKGEILLPDEYPAALGYGPWVEEVWFNYISNALKYGGRPPRVEITSAVQDDGYVRFYVNDNGEGLTPEQQAQLFTPLTRLGRSDLKGSGLGLSIVQRIVVKLDGQVGVESEIGKGSSFSFTLHQADGD